MLNSVHCLRSIKLNVPAVSLSHTSETTFWAFLCVMTLCNNSERMHQFLVSSFSLIICCMIFVFCGNRKCDLTYVCVEKKKYFVRVSLLHQSSGRFFFSSDAAEFISVLNVLLSLFSLCEALPTGVPQDCVLFFTQYKGPWTRSRELFAFSFFF